MKKKVEFCAGHAHDRMIDLYSRRCAQPGCGKGPNFGAEGTKKVNFCAGHARNGMVDLKSTKCAKRGCIKIPALGVRGTRQREKTPGTGWSTSRSERSAQTRAAPGFLRLAWPAPRGESSAANTPRTG